MKRSRVERKEEREREREREREMHKNEKKERDKDKGERSFITQPTNKRAYARTAWRTGRKKRLCESNESTFY